MKKMQSLLAVATLLLGSLAANAQGVAPITTSCEDITVAKLHEADNFARTDETNDGDRFGAPKYWTVENFGFGDEAGIDNVTGTDCLHLENWWNDYTGAGYDIHNARIYQQVTLPAGRYYFGAEYPSAESNDQCYIFASETILNTSDLPTQSIGYEKVKGTAADGKFYGFYFTLESEKNVYLGFQGDFTTNCTNIRVKAVKLLYYGDIDYTKLQELVTTIEDQLTNVTVNDNTGYYSKQAYDELVEVINEVKATDENASFDTFKTQYNNLNFAYNDFLKNGKNVGGAPLATGYNDLTIEKLSEQDNFARTDETNDGDRFGAPLHWTVENFGFGDEAGIDHNPGYDCLHLEVWWNGNAFSEKGYDIHNTRIYQQVTLPAGRYCFAASYPSAEANDVSYIFASETILNTSDIPTQSIAFEKVNVAPADGTFRGIYFTLNDTKTIYLGFQADFSTSNTNNIRCSGVRLYSYEELTYAKLMKDVEDIKTGLNALTINENTGFYSETAYDALLALINETTNGLSDNSDNKTLNNALVTISDAYNEYLQKSKNTGTTYNSDGMSDITVAKLVESSDFTRADAEATTRFAAPKNWTVENYDIPSASEGVRSGLDNYPGYDCLTLGVWDDKGNAPATSDIANARVYRKVQLDAGRYYFGAVYNTINNLGDAYIFAASKTLSTTDIPSQSIAYMKITDSKSDGEYWGISFTLDEPQEVLLGWQADLKNSPNAQEFRAKNVVLARKATGTVPVTITDAGYATYVSDYDLDFTDLDVKAYKASVSGTTITFQKVTQVPAGQGVLLQNKGTFNVPVTTGVAEWNDNAFIRGTDEAVATGDGPYNYILNKVNDVVGFYRAASQTVAKNRAYLQAGINTTRILINFDEQATDIKGIENEKMNNNTVYDLLGRRVNANAKRPYIHNGKKFIVK